MKVLITGGTGFVGSHVAEHYAKKGDDIVCYDNLSRADLLKKKINKMYNWNYLKKFSNIQLIKSDIRDFKKLKDVSKYADVIIHAAAQTAVTTSVQDPRIDFEVNAIGTFNVLEAARLAHTNPTIVYCSTNKVYGENVNKIKVIKKDHRYVFEEKFKNGISETFPIDLCEHTPYGCSKLAGDFYVQDYGYLYGLKTGAFRMSCVYGIRQFGVEDQGWLAWFTIATILEKPITIYGDGKQVRDILYIEDLIKAFDLFVNSNLKQEVFNIGGGPDNTISLLELLDLLQKLTGKRSDIKFTNWRPSDQKVYISDISKIREKLNWKPKTNPEDGIRNCVHWLKENKSIFEEIK